MTELLVATTIGLPVVAGAIAWFASERLAAPLAMIAFAFAALAGLALSVGAVVSGGSVAFSGTVRLDPLGAYVVLLVLVVSAISVAGSPAHLAHERHSGSLDERDAGRYYALLLWFIAGLTAVPMLDNLGLLWVAIEAATIVSALLVGFARTPAAIEAAWKYLILGSVGIGFALLGTLLLYASSVGALGETSDALNWTRLVAVAGQLDPGLVRLAFIFALVGYGTKAGLAPFHTWLPDAHSQAPSPVSALLSGASLAVALYALARFHLVAVGVVGTAFSSTLLVAFGLLSLAVALPFIVAQGDLKRLLAYSSIEHIGLAALALGFGGQLALVGLGLHLLTHGLTKATLFLAAGQLVAARRSRRIGRLGGSLAALPVDGRALLVGSLIIGGLPPSGLFVAEIAILFGGVQQGWGWAAGLAAVLLALTMAGFLFHVARVTFGASTLRQPAPPGRLRWAVLLGLPLIAVIAAGLWTPAPLSVLFEQVARILGGGHG